MHLYRLTEPVDTRRCAVCDRAQQDCDCDAEGAALDREIAWSWDADGREVEP